MILVSGGAGYIGANTIIALHEMGYKILGMDGTAENSVEDGLRLYGRGPVALVLGSEGPGLRQLTKDTCDALVRIESPSGFGSLNVSNAAAVALFAAVNRNK